MSWLKQSWSEHRQWSQRDLSHRRYVYGWADGVYSNVRMDDRLCWLVIKQGVPRQPYVDRID